ncbi:16S rRNA (guanine(527)-N(7))-methyltransferase RsmG [Helicobacter sp. 16-1353]|uniref:16S rRNA (guanine(527)-N(7))-methyltransferase RsmG n=1 Tax=Helicobacter sp. 16-1353 TaxID=2004996 RepID=UPI000DCF361B|nr:16S rRNA (guanine(527)-N(7))-methyltransferase RsmG [Helicobacter sp. 16-1353]RAX51500.1 16S rRNA (guanine(527)-N(7))-methyltransferase RsmG [Helicobacter sp. 16-1353]
MIDNKKFEIFCDELLKWNKIHNLTGYKTKSQIYENIEDSIYPLEFIADFNNAMDIGSGNGFPAILLAIVKEKSHFTLVEPNNKKASFLQIVALKLGLKNVSVIKNTIQNIPPKEHFDLITSRALFETQKLINLSKDFLDKNGYFLFYKGSLEKSKDLVESSNYINRHKRIYFYKAKSEV